MHGGSGLADAVAHWSAIDRRVAAASAAPSADELADEFAAALAAALATASADRLATALAGPSVDRALALRAPEEPFVSACQPYSSSFGPSGRKRFGVKRISG
jgi:hypothetical protein